ncbi:unnamed protein product, partial [Iphiclides podalirius]
MSIAIAPEKLDVYRCVGHSRALCSFRRSVRRPAAHSPLRPDSPHPRRPRVHRTQGRGHTARNASPYHLNDSGPHQVLITIVFGNDRNERAGKMSGNYFVFRTPPTRRCG